MEKNILNIYCPSCGAPAQFDIVHQEYRCSYCGGKVALEKAKNEKSQIRRKYEKFQEKEYALEMTNCSGCGASVVFEEGEALSKCEFCGRSLVRKRYTRDAGLPHYVIPFGVTAKEAQERLSQWCEQNGKTPEAKLLRGKIPQLKGYYLPYEMVQGPVHCSVYKRSEYTKYEADGYLNEEFVNCSGQLDNRILDAMEPYDTEHLEEFDYSYIAGHRVKVSDIDGQQVSDRLKNETKENYRARFEQLWGTRDIEVQTSVQPVIRFPVLLPAYYYSDGEVKAAVNGQTGKVSVSSKKAGRYFVTPWWLKGLLVLLLSLGLTFGAVYLGGNSLEESLGITGMLGIFFLIVFACMFQDGGSTDFGFRYYDRIFNSGEQTFRREKGRLVPSEAVLKRKIAEPVFTQVLDGKKTQVSYTFYSFKRMVSMVVTSLLVIFCPVLIALVVNGFDFQRLDLAGSAVWFLITVPTVPIYLIRFGIQWLYENPQIFVLKEDGRRVPLRKTRKYSFKDVVKVLASILGFLIVPPYCFISWLVLGSLGCMIYFTAFGL